MPRSGGRLADELRPVHFELNYVLHPEGSVLVDSGLTRVLCNVTVEPGVPRWREASGAGWLTAEYAMLPRSTHTRSARDEVVVSARAQEIRRLIGRALRTAVDLERLGQRTLTVDCDVIQADGGTRTAAITGGWLAVALALRRLAMAGELPDGVLRTGVAAVSAGLVDGVAMLDLDYAEDSRAAVDFNVVMTAGGRFVEIQGTAEGRPFERAQLSELLGLAESGIRQLLAAQQQALRAANL